MTFELELTPEAERFIETQAAQNGTTPQHYAVQILEEAARNNQSDDALFDAATARVFDKYQHAFEVLAEGAK